RLDRLHEGSKPALGDRVHESEPETLLAREHAVDPALLVRRGGVERGESLRKTPKTVVAADAVVDQEPFERFAASRSEEDHRLVNAVEDRLALLRCSGIAPRTGLLRCFEIGHESHGELAGLLLGFATSRWRGRFSRLKQRASPLRYRQEACARALHLNERRECLQVRSEALCDLSGCIVFE